MANNTSDDELRSAVLAKLKHAYFNAKTDTVALKNGVITNHNHALGILENHTDELMQLIKQREEQVALEARIDELEHIDQSAGWLDDHAPRRMTIRQRLSELKRQLTTTHKGDQ